MPLTDADIGLVPAGPVGLSDEEIGLAPSPIRLSNQTPGIEQGFVIPKQKRYQEVANTGNPLLYTPLADPSEATRFNMFNKVYPVPQDATEGMINALGGAARFALSPAGVATGPLMAESVVGPVIAGISKLGAAGMGAHGVYEAEKAQFTTPDITTGQTVENQINALLSALMMLPAGQKAWEVRQQMKPITPEVLPADPMQPVGPSRQLGEMIPDAEVVPFKELEGPKGRYVVNRQGQTVNAEQMSPMEMTEFQRLAQAYDLRNIRQMSRKRESQASPVIIGEQPPVQTQPIIQDPYAINRPPAGESGIVGVQRPTRPPLEPAGGNISFAAPAMAGGIPSAGQSSAGPSRISEQEALMQGNFIPSAEKPTQAEQKPMSVYDLSRSSEGGQISTGTSGQTKLQSVEKTATSSLPELIKGERLVTIQRADGSTYDASFGDKYWNVPSKGKVASIGRVKEGTAVWSHGMLEEGETIKEKEQSQGGESAQGKKGRTYTFGYADPTTWKKIASDTLRDFKDFAGWSGKMVEKLGEEARPHLRAMWQATKEAELRGPFSLSGPRLAITPEEIGFKDTSKPVDALQLRNRLKNKLTPTEWSFYEDSLPKEGKVSPEEAARLMQESGPRVEVKKFGSGIKTPTQKENLDIVHQLDTLLGGGHGEQLVQRGRGEVEKYLDELRASRNPAVRERALELYSAYDRNTMLDVSGQEANWQSISPKAEKDMPGYVEIAVVKPIKAKRKLTDEELDKYSGGADDDDWGLPEKVKEEIGEQFPSSHNFPPNTLVFTRGYMETLPDGKKAFHVIEVQSDWGQRAREFEKQAQREEASPGEMPSSPATYRKEAQRLSDPLLKDYNRLALKAAIDHAKKEGADSIVIQDAESAMLMEGHDLAASTTIVPGEYTINGSDGKKHKILVGELNNVKIWDKNAWQPLNEIGSGYYSKTLFDDILKQVPSTHEMGQEKGMRLNYDSILPKIAEELTGSKGEKVSLGEHKMAFDMRSEHGVATADNQRIKRKNLIFRNPDGSFKTNVSGLKFPIKNLPEKFSLFEKDRPENRATRLYMNPVGPILKQTAKDVKELGKKLGEYFKAPPDVILPTLDFSSDTIIPDYQPIEVGNKIASQPFASERIPILGRLMGGKARIRTPQDVSVARWYMERHGIGPANAAVVGLRIKGEINKAFKVNKQGDLNVKPTKAGQSLKTSDVFEALRSDPEAYILTPEQRAAFDNYVAPIAKRMTELAQKYKIIDEMVDESGDLRPYFPRIVTKHPKIENLGPTQASKQRAFSTEAEGWKRGYEYELNPEKRLVSGITRLYRAIANQRLASDPVLGAKSLEQIQAELKQSFAEELGSGAMTQKKIDRIAEGIRTRGQVMQPILVRRIFDQKVAKMLNKEFAAEASTVRNSISSANSLIKAITLGFDAGVGQIQLLPTLYNNPRVWAKSQLKSWHAFADSKVFSEYVKKNKKEVSELAQMGSSIGQLQEMMSGLGEGQLLSKVPVVGQVGKAFGRQFQTGLDVAKIELWKALREVTPKSEWPKVVRGIEASLLTSRMESAMVPHGRSLLERVALNAPSYYRGAVDLVAALAESGATGKQTRRVLGKFLLGGMLTYISIAKMLDMSEEEIEERLDPRRTDFMTWKVKQEGGNVNVGFGGIYRSLLRLGGNIAATSAEHPENWKSLSSEKNPLTRWYRGHAGPVPSLTWDAFSGKDFLGRETDLYTLGQRTLPLIAQQGTKKEGEASATSVEYTSSFFGLTAFPESFSKKRWEVLNESAQRKFNKEYKDLSLGQRRAVTKETKKTLEDLPKGMTPERQREIALKRSDERTVELRESLSEPVKKWLDKHNLEASGYSTSHTYAGEKITFTKEELERLHELMVEEYNEKITKSTTNPNVEKMSYERKKQYLSGKLELARASAWRSLERELRERTQAKQ